MKTSRAVLGLLLGLGFAVPAFGQTTTLTINGATATTNTGTVNVTAGSTLTMTIQNAALPNRLYGLFCGLANNGASTGWFLDVSAGKNPFPIVTGVPTLTVEANYPPLDIVPDRGLNPSIKLDSSGKATLTFSISNGMSGTFYFQSVTLPSGSSTTNFSNAVTVIIGAPTTSARLLISKSAAVSVDDVEFGVLQFTADPSTGSYSTADPTLTHIKVDGLAMGDTQEWSPHNNITAGNNPIDKARDIDWQSGTGPSLNNENNEYARIELPPLPGADGILGTADDIPARELMRCFDQTTQEGFFLIVNKGANPNSPGVDFYQTGTRKKDSVPTNNAWTARVAVSPDGSRMAAIYDDSSVAIDPKMFLIATDCSKPFKDINNVSVDIVDVTPATTKTLFQQGIFFTANRLWFIKDPGTSADSDAVNDRTLWTVPMRVTQPTPSQVVFPLNRHYTAPAPVVDVVLDRCFLTSKTYDRICIAAGDTLITGASPTPDQVQRGDWYCVTELKPTAAVNLTDFPVIAGNSTAKIYSTGSSYNGQSGYASLSADGSLLAFTALHNNENGVGAGDDDEIYLCHTADTDGDGYGDDAANIFNSSTLWITNNARIDSRGGTSANTLDNAYDLFLADNDNLYFFYGVTNSTSDKQMDLFHYKLSTALLTNTTKTGDFTLPITTQGNILPEGYFASPSGRYLIWSRGRTSFSFTDLVGLDTQTEAVFNITGSEFGGVKTSTTANNNAPGENVNWHLSFAGGSFPSLVYFAAPIDNGSDVTPQGMNVWAFDANYPSAAVELTSDNTSKQGVESLTGSPYNMGCAFAWTANTTVNVGATDKADFEYQDLQLYFLDDLTESSRARSLPLGAITFLCAGKSTDSTGTAPPALICGIGDTGIDQPTDGDFYFFSLNGSDVRAPGYKYTTTTGIDAPGHKIGSVAKIIQVYAVTKP